MEEARSSAADGSVCKVSVDDAADLYDSYDRASGAAKDIVDQCVVYTWKGDGSSDKQDTSYALVVIQLGKRGGILPGNAIYGNNIFAGNNTAILVIMIVSIVGVLSLSCFLIYKKKNK